MANKRSPVFPRMVAAVAPSEKQRLLHSAAVRRSKSPSRLVMLSVNQMHQHALQLILEERRDFRVLATTATIEQAESACVRWRAAALIVDVGSVGSQTRRRLLENVADRLSSRYPVVLLLGPAATDESTNFPPGIRCAVAVEDGLDEWPLVLSAAVRGACHLSPSVTKRMRVAGATPPSLINPGEKPLSPRERDLVELTRCGLMPGEIARRWGRSVKTVEAHFQRVKVKLGLCSIGELRRRVLPAATERPR